MTAEELRIGNIVKTINTIDIFKLVSIGYDYVLLTDEYNDYDSLIEELSPISLTEEWLLKFGFERTFKNLKGCYVDKHGKYMLCDNNENGFDIYIYGYDEDLYINSVNYIHQLQNLYFALTGEELICK